MQETYVEHPAKTHNPAYYDTMLFQGDGIVLVGREFGIHLGDSVKNCAQSNGSQSSSRVRGFKTDLGTHE